MPSDIKHFFDMPSNLKKASKFWWLLVGMWLFLSLSQTLHFYFYFEQSLWDSVRWSTRDWLVWFIIFAGVYKLCLTHKTLLHFNAFSILAVTTIALSSGLLQTLLITSLDFIAGTATRPFWEDLLRYYNKRWLQHLFIFSVFWLFMLNQLKFRGKTKETPSQPSLKVISKIQVNDGKSVHWLEPEDIYHIEAAGNYICFHTKNGQLIERSTLKQISLKLDSSQFVRVSRSNIINLQKIVSCNKVSRTKVELSLTDDFVVAIGPTYWNKLKPILAR
jgi:hypothetical protein